MHIIEYGLTASLCFNFLLQSPLDFYIAQNELQVWQPDYFALQIRRRRCTSSTSSTSGTFSTVSLLGDWDGYSDIVNNRYDCLSAIDCTFVVLKVSKRCLELFAFSSWLTLLFVLASKSFWETRDPFLLCPLAFETSLTADPGKRQRDQMQADHFFVLLVVDQSHAVGRRCFLCPHDWVSPCVGNCREKKVIEKKRRPYENDTPRG